MYPDHLMLRCKRDSVVINAIYTYQAGCHHQIKLVWFARHSSLISFSRDVQTCPTPVAVVACSPYDVLLL